MLYIQAKLWYQDKSIQSKLKKKAYVQFQTNQK